MPLMNRPTSCDHCGADSRVWTRVRFRGKHLCSLACAAQVKEAERKVALDAEDASPTVCRCAGPPAPLWVNGVHCSQCRRMFSAGVRLWMATGDRSARELGRLGRVRLGYETLVLRLSGSGRSPTLAR